MMSLWYFELAGKIEEDDEKKKYLIVSDTVPNEVLDKTKQGIDIEELIILRC